MRPSSVILLPDASLDLRAAAEHVGVEFRDLVAAVARDQLAATAIDPCRPGVWMVVVADLDRWARRWRADRAERLMGSPDTLS